MNAVTQTRYQENDVWFSPVGNLWQTKKNGKIINWARWAYEHHHGPIPKGAKVFWKNDDRSVADPSRLQLFASSRTNRSSSQFVKDREFVLRVIAQQRKNTFSWYLTHGYGRIGSRFGSVWIDEHFRANQDLKNKMIEINKRWPRHWQKK